MVQKQKSITKPKVVRIIETITYWVGTPLSIGIHTVFFIISFLFVAFGVSFDKVLLVVTTIVSLEAIYLSLFIQMTVNQHTKSLQSVEEDIDDIQEDIDDIQEEVEDVGEDIDKIQLEDKEENAEEAEDARVFASIEHQLSKIGTDMTTLRQEIQTLKHRPSGSNQHNQI